MEYNILVEPLLAGTKGTLPMTSTTALKSSTYKLLGRKDLIALAAENLSCGSKVLLVCDLDAGGDAKFSIFLKALQTADLVTDEQKDKVICGDLHLVMVSFNSLTIAESVYRQIPHASHFVSIWMDGEPYTDGC